MTDCNYLYLVAMFSFLLALNFWGIFLMGVLLSGFGGSFFQWGWRMLTKWTGAETNAERKGYILAIRDMLLYFACPMIIFCAGYLIYWHFHTDGQVHSGLAEGKNGGERAKVGNVDLRWVPDGGTGYWMMEHEVSFGLWREVSPHHSESPRALERYPVSFSTSFAIVEFVRNMERHHSVRGWSWEVPTERQWLDAFHAGSDVEMSMQTKLNQGWLGILPIALFFAFAVIRDTARPFWRELTGKDAHAVRVAKPLPQVRPCLMSHRNGILSSVSTKEEINGARKGE